MAGTSNYFIKRNIKSISHLNTEVQQNIVRAESHQQKKRESQFTVRGEVPAYLKHHKEFNQSQKDSILKQIEHNMGPAGTRRLTKEEVVQTRKAL
mmetsp:Transcript_11268/g.18967  ORF Transcript_11268/g.18967 Transcript_11268/m.18967 type:complete len:95 (+) Transcript_11268:333-617(+)